MEGIHSENNQITAESFSDLELIQAKSGRLVMASDSFGRDYNEDRIFFDPEQDAFMVVDGMGGYGNGGLAADSVVEAMDEGLKEHLPPEQMQIRAFEIMKRSGVKEGGACYVAGQISKKELKLWFAGDVKAIVFDNRGKIKLKTSGSSLNDVPRGIRPGSPKRDQIRLMNYDRILVASDGLFDNATLDEILGISKNQPIGQAMKDLAGLVAVRMMGKELPDGGFGNKDNLSILMYEILPVDLNIIH